MTLNLGQNQISDIRNVKNIMSEFKIRIKNSYPYLILLDRINLNI